MLPYVPTTILSPTNSSRVQIFRPTSDGSKVEIQSLDFGGSLSTSDLTGLSTTTQLPFNLDRGSTLTPFVSADGRIYSITGQCEKGADDIKLWTYAPGFDTADGPWTEEKITVNGIKNSARNGGANLLATGIAFTSSTNSDPQLFVFGGMCPNSTDLTLETWQDSGTYSNAMLALEKATGKPDYGLSMLWNRGPPIPEAGFSVTPLQPTFFNSSDGDRSQQQNFVLIGGQTPTAFINMSQVALFSLPEQAWTFIPIEEPLTGLTTDLTRKDIGAVDPRSGHAAVLSEDGRKIVVLGGWVGDISTPAEPQLAVLEIGEGYGGGSREWRWAVPEQNGAGIGNGAGVYGHGATLLPGNVIMVTGGYDIAISSSRLLRRADPIPSTATHFFNITSSTWVGEYTNPSPLPNDAPSVSAPADDGSEKKGWVLGQDWDLVC